MVKFNRYYKEVLRPGVYKKKYKQSDGSIVERRHTITLDDCRQAFRSVRALADAGFDIPFVYEHTDPDPLRTEGEGLPADWDSRLREKEHNADLAQQLARTVGRVVSDDPRNAITLSGSVNLAIDVLDGSDADKQLKSGLVKFVSPELRRVWTDWRERSFPRCFTHIAATHRPVQSDQEPGFLQLSDDSATLFDVLGVVQLSLDEIEVPTVAKTLTASQKFNRKALLAEVSLFKAHADRLVAQLSDVSQLGDDDSDDDDKKKKKDEPPLDAVLPAVDDSAAEPVADPVETNPDMPAGDDTDTAKKFSALMGHLGKIGLVLQSDTTAETLVDRLLTAVMTYNAANDRAAADEVEEEPEAAIEEQPSAIAQMSDAATLAYRDRLGKKILSLKKGGILQEGSAGKLLAKLGSIQLSDGKEVPSVDYGTMGAVLDCLEGGQSLVAPLLEDQTGDYQLSDPTAPPPAKERQHPRGDDFFKVDQGAIADQDDPRAEKITNDFLKANGVLPKSQRLAAMKR